MYMLCRAAIEFHGRVQNIASKMKASKCHLSETTLFV